MKNKKTMSSEISLSNVIHTPGDVYQNFRLSLSDPSGGTFCETLT